MIGLQKTYSTGMCILVRIFLNAAHVSKYEVNELTWQKIMACAMVMAP